MYESDDSANQVLNPVVFMIFGVAGDLAYRKLIPALFNLFCEDRMPAHFQILGLDQDNLDTGALLVRLKAGINQFARDKAKETDAWQRFTNEIRYVQADFTDSAIYQKLSDDLADIEKQWNGQADHIFYMAVPPFLFGTIATRLGEAGLAQDKERSRLVVEKPVGHDLDSVKILHCTLSKYFHESQIFRIDHYLGKETVQNILAFRFANPMFEPIWDRRYVDHVTITVAEELGIGKRAGYYEHAGALRDMVQNHLLQLLCLVAMEPPILFEADEIRNKKVEVLKAIRPIQEDNIYNTVVRGQYDSGWVEGEFVKAYRDEPGVAPDSTTETFVALKLFVDNWRWQGVPFYLRTGKRLPKKVSEISIRFQSLSHQIFPARFTQGRHPARLVICIQPDEAIVLKFLAKQPGPDMRLKPVTMHFCYEEEFRQPSPEAYETLLLDLMRNDPTLFMRADQVEEAWKILMPVIDFWSTDPPDDFPNYKAGTWGPEAAEALIAIDGRYWLRPSGPLLYCQTDLSGGVREAAAGKQEEAARI